MASITQPLPGLVSIPRITTLLASLLVALSSGTNYVYSAYAPQLGARLHITHTQLNVIGLAGNVGVYSSGPVWGKIVDSRGPRLPLTGAFVFLLAGYSGIRHFYNAGVPGDSTLSTISFYLLVLCSFLTGAGGNGGLTSSVNATARTFPDRARATTTGVVVSGFGLSAFLFSTIAHVAFAGDTSSFLRLLSLGTAFPMIIGFFFVRPIPLPPSELIRGLEHGIADTGLGDAATSVAVFQHENDSLARLLSQDELGETVLEQQTDLPQSSDFGPSNIRNSVELTRSHSPDTTRHRSRSSGGGQSLSRAAKTLHDGLPNIYGRRLWMSGDFWLLFIILSLLSGTGLMYINNVGSMSQALFAKGNPSYDEVEASRWQATQVSTISIMNFSGRIFIGLVSDFGKNRLQLPRSYSLVLVSFFFLISQITAANVDNVSRLWVASALLGLAHGSVFSLYPTVCIEWFGLPHFSENWGYLSLSPMFGGNLFSVAFGRNLDAHEPPEPQNSLATAGATVLSASRQCLEGRECYVNSLQLTIASCILAMILSVWAGWRDRQKIAAAEIKLPRRNAEVIWEGPEE